MPNATDYTAQLQALLPPGPLWDALRQPGTTAAELVAALAEELARLDARTEDLLAELDPRSALELLSEWEAFAGIYDACAPETPETVQERRLAVHAKLTGTGGQTRAYYAGLAAALGYTATIQEYHPFRAGASAPGDALTNDDWIYRWLVRVAEEANLRPFRAGQSLAGEPIATWGDDRLECAINHLKPAHTEVGFGYGV